MEILKLQDLSKVFGDNLTRVKALNKINLSIEQGEFIAIIGESGSGKSTLLSIMAGLDKATVGDVEYNGKIFKNISSTQLANIRKRDISMIYQFYNLIPSLTVKENIILPVLLDNKEINEEKLEELLIKFKLKERENFYIDDLSGGQRQKIAIARSLMNKSNIILADEPTGNLDTVSSSEVINLLKNENEKNGTTVVIVTHNLEIAKICSRIITLKDGSIISDVKNKEL